MHWGLELLSHLMPLAPHLKHHFIGRGLSLENAINTTTKKEIERSKKNTLIANLIANLVVV